MDQVTFFEDCPPQILLGPFLNTLTHIPDQILIDFFKTSVLYILLNAYI